MAKTLLEIIVVTWNSRAEIVDCLEALSPLPDGWHVTVVDNLSSDGTAELVRETFDWVTVIANEENVGFAKANNQVISTSDSEYVLLLNPDTVASRDTIERAIGKLQARPKAAVLGVRILNNDGSLQPSCQRFPSLWNSLLIAFGVHAILPAGTKRELLLSDSWAHDTERTVDTVCGAFMLVKRDAIETVGALPDQYFLYYEETDWCYRMWKHGREVWFTPDLSIMHHGNKSGQQKPSEWRTSLLYESKYKFCRHNYGAAVTKMIQALDLVGCTIRKWYYSTRRKNAENERKFEFMRLSQTLARRALLSK